MTKAIDDYVHSVVDRLPRAWPARPRIEADLRLHLTELVEETGSEQEAIERMGPADRVTAEFLAQFPLVPTSLPRRLAAFLLDMLVVVFPFLPMIWIAVNLREEAGAGISAATPVVMTLSIILGLAAIAYFPVLEALFGQTVGKRLLGTCVVREDGSRVGWAAAIVRRLPFFMNFFPLDALFIFFTARRQRAFDKVAGTLVIGCR
jgi:uncharacterized RDD family membrane protein YckC